MGFLQRLMLLGIFLLSCKHNAPSLSSNSDLSAAPKGRTYNEYGDYLIDINDLISVYVQGNKEITGSYRVSPSGYMALPIAGSVRAKGVSEMQLRDAITTKLRPHVNGPRVALAVTEAKSYMVYVSGLVQKPGTYHLDNRTTLLQGISLAGGWQDQQARRIVIVRETFDGLKKRYETSFANARFGNAFIDNFYLERGDLIIVE